MADSYKIEQHGPYRRWIVVRNGEDVSAHDRREQALDAVYKSRAKDQPNPDVSTPHEQQERP